MNITVFTSGNDVFTNCECIKGYAFKMAAPRGKSAHFAFNSAALQFITARVAGFFANSQYNCGHFDKTISLSPFTVS